MQLLSHPPPQRAGVHMPVLENLRHQAFAQPRARDALMNDADVSAGSAPHKGHLSRLACRAEVAERIAGLRVSQTLADDNSREAGRAILDATQSGDRPGRPSRDLANEFRDIAKTRIGEGPRPDAHKRPESAPAAPRRLPRAALRPPVNLPRTARPPPATLPSGSLVAPGRLRPVYPAPRASNSFSVSRSSQASSAATSSSRAASRAVEVRAKAAGSRP
jgi:hypothetical protein